MDTKIKYLVVVVGVVSALFAIYRGYIFYVDRRDAKKVESEKLDDELIDEEVTVTPTTIEEGSTTMNDAAVSSAPAESHV